MPGHNFLWPGYFLSAIAVQYNISYWFSASSTALK